jgi:hypothetical protein
VAVLTNSGQSLDWPVCVERWPEELARISQYGAGIRWPCSAFPSRSRSRHRTTVSAERLLNLGIFRIIVGEFGRVCQPCLQNGSTETKPNRHNGPEWRLFHASVERAWETALVGWGTRIRTSTWRNQNRPVALISFTFFPTERKGDHLLSSRSRPRQ